MDEKITEFIIKIISELSELNAYLKTALDKISEHDRRLDDLEKNKSGLKDTLIALLIKGLVASVFVIGTLTGAASLIKGVLGL